LRTTIYNGGIMLLLRTRIHNGVLYSNGLKPEK
jgi:hypothetical protein